MKIFGSKHGSMDNNILKPSLKFIEKMDEKKEIQPSQYRLLHTYQHTYRFPKLQLLPSFTSRMIVHIFTEPIGTVNVANNSNN